MRLIASSVHTLVRVRVRKKGEIGGVRLVVRNTILLLLRLSGVVPLIVLVNVWVKALPND